MAEEHNGAASVGALLSDLAIARDEFMAELANVDPARLETPGLVGEWSARELIAHLGYWAGNAAQTIHAVEGGRVDELDDDADLDVDAVNATVARVARDTDGETVGRREAASFEALVERVRSLDPTLLGLVLPDGGTLEKAIRVDGPDHYREHTEALREIVERTRG